MATDRLTAMSDQKRDRRYFGVGVDDGEMGRVTASSPRALMVVSSVGQ
jgi:hypothetical protein